MQVLEHIKMTLLSCPLTSPLTPGAAILMRVLEHIKITSHSCCFTRDIIPSAALAPEPLQCLQVTTLGCISACPNIPSAALAPEPLHCLQVTTLAGTGKETLNQLEPLLGFQPLQGLQLASLRCEEEKQRKWSEAKTKRDCEREDSPAALVMRKGRFFEGLTSSCT